MPRNKIKDDDLDFKIFVDPSCLSESMEDIEPSAASLNTDTDTPATAQPSMDTIDQVPDAILPTTESTDLKETATVTVDDIETPQEQEIPVENVVVEDAVPAAEEEVSHDVSSVDQPDEPVAEPVEEPEQNAEVPAGGSEPSTEDQVEEPATEAESDDKEEEPVQLEAEPNEDQQEEPSPVEEELAAEPETPAAEQEDAQVDDEQVPEPADEALEGVPTDEQIPEEGSHSAEETPDAEQPEEHTEEEAVHEEVDTHSHEEAEEPTTDDATPPTSSQVFTDRKTSLRTEALIQAAARAVVARIERRQASGDNVQQEEDEDVEASILSTATEEGDTILQQYEQEEEETSSRRQSTNSTGSQLHHDVPSNSISGDEGGESSSHNEPESDDVFSDRSARSSIASFEGAEANDEDVTLKSPMLQAHDESAETRSLRSSTRSPRMSGVSLISDLSQYDKDDFAPTNREARLPFRTPSAIRNLQMSSPTPSVIHGSSPRSAKRQNGASGGLPTISRLGSPNVTTTQFSPKGRSTPTRLKSRREAPLVLLHVTVLPLRWMWGDILNCLDALNGKTFGENKELFEASEQLKSLRDSWRELQDHVSDTVLERGVLIPHPQNDYEVLEERLLESLDLPLRRRARILECGHYLGPSNEFGDEEEYDESEDEYASQSGETTGREEKRHWCNTCRNEIKYEDLGPGKVFRVKVYASNGLMRAGAWEACWKEMERVDIEVEPIVEMSVQNELEKLIIINGELEEKRQRELEEAEAEAARAAEAAARAAAQEEEAQLAAMHDQSVSRPQSVAANAMVIQEPTRFNEEQALPAPEMSRSIMDTPTTQDQRMISSPSPSSMQMMTMHVSPAQPPSTVASPHFASPSPQPHQPSPLRHAILPPEEPSSTDMSMAVSEDRIRQEAEDARLREMYADTPQHQHQHQQPLAAIEPATVDPVSTASSMYPHHPTSSSRHPDSYIPPPSPRSPSEEAYERQRRRNSEDSRSRGRSAHSQAHSHKSSSAATGQTLDLENASFMDLFLEAFKVLLRDPKNVAIIVLCLFVAVMLGRPSTTPAQTGLQVVPRGDMNEYKYEAPKVPVPEAVVAPAPVAPVLQQPQSQPQVESVEVVQEVQTQTQTVQVPVMVVTTTLTTAPAEPSVEVEVLSEETVVEPEPEPESLVEPAPVFELEAPVEVSSVAEETAEDAAVLEEEHAAEPAEPEELPHEEPEEISAFDDTVETTESVVPPEVEEQLESPLVEEKETEESSPLTAEVQEEVSVSQDTDAPMDDEPSTVEPAEETVSSTIEEPEAMPTAAIMEETESEYASEDAATESEPESVSEEAATTTKTDPCTPSIVSQRTTLRIYETITETVTVSAVTASTSAAVAAETMTETEAEAAPVTETAVPQTVEETVYETETVRVTVSVSASASASASALPSGVGHDEL
ncbi:hypothetical protein V8F20_002751 [Naviculisporaceae sp. PSN 640]